MKFRYILENLETGEKTPYKTLRDIATFIKIDYHQARSVLLSEEKLYIHPVIKMICSKYKIIHNPEITN